MSKPDSKSIITILLLCLGIVLSIGLICFVLFHYSSEERAKRQISLGDKYFSEMKYEEAILEYETAIGIDSALVDTYIKLSDVYIAMGDEIEESDPDRAIEYYNEALHILEEAKGRVDSRDRRLLDKQIDRINELDGYSVGSTEESPDEEELTEKSVEEIAEEVTGLPYTGSESYQLTYHLNTFDNETAMEQVSMTYPEPYRLLIGANKYDYDKDGSEEILSIVLERDQMNDEGFLLFQMIEGINDSWHSNSDIRIPVSIYEKYDDTVRTDIFYKGAENPTIYIEDVASASSFADGLSYSFSGIVYDGGILKERFQRIESAGSDGPGYDMISGMPLDEIESYYDDPYEDSIVQKMTEEIHNSGQSPKRLGMDYPICESAGENVLLSRLERKNDAGRLGYYKEDSDYGYDIDSEGNFGKIDLTISSY